MAFAPSASSTITPFPVSASPGLPVLDDHLLCCLLQEVPYDCLWLQSLPTYSNTSYWTGSNPLCPASNPALWVAQTNVLFFLVCFWPLLPLCMPKQQLRLIS